MTFLSRREVCLRTSNATKERIMSKALREQRAQAHAEGLRALRDNNRAAFDKAMTEVDRLAVEIQKSEARGSANRFDVADPGHKRAFAFAKWLRGGDNAINQ